MARRPGPLSDEERERALTDLPDWSGDAAALRRTVELPSFAHAVRALLRVAAVAEERDHHPDVDLRWRSLRFTLTTHSAGAVTVLDVDLAHAVDAVVRDVAASRHDDVRLHPPGDTGT